MTRSGLFFIAVVALTALRPNTAAAQTAMIAGVPDYQDTDFAGNNDCAPVAAACVLGYWDSHGYPDLINGSASLPTNPTGVTDLVDRLKSAMHWSSTGTQLVLIPPAVAATTAARGYRFWSYTHYSVSWDDLTAQVNAGRPSMFTLAHPLYQNALHTTACVGYNEQDSARIAIVHDNWNNTPEDVYLNYDECYGRSLTAVVQPESTHVLTVGSSPIPGVAMSGTQPGSTFYTAVVPDLMPVRLTAAANLTSGHSRYRFVRWTIDGVAQPPTLDAASFSMKAHQAAVAVYELQTLPGDVTRDCKVNILDLIFVRNRLGQSPLSDDNWQADVNLDGKINLLDMVSVRNRLGTVCSP